MVGCTREALHGPPSSNQKLGSSHDRRRIYWISQIKPSRSINQLTNMYYDSDKYRWVKSSFKNKKTTVVLWKEFPFADSCSLIRTQASFNLLHSSCHSFLIPPPLTHLCPDAWNVPSRYHADLALNYITSKKLSHSYLWVWFHFRMNKGKWVVNLNYRAEQILGWFVLLQFFSICQSEALILQMPSDTPHTCTKHPHKRTVSTVHLRDRGTGVDQSRWGGWDQDTQDQHEAPHVFDWPGKQRLEGNTHPLPEVYLQSLLKSLCCCQH